LLVLAGGFCGATLRYALSKPLLQLASALPDAHAGFPYDILLINLSGAFAIGLLFGAFEHGAPLSPDARLALGTGFLGAYTTFSSYMVGAATLLRHGQTLPALLYLCGALAAGAGLAWAGFTLAGMMFERQRAWGLSESDEMLVEGGWEDAPDESASPGALLRREDVVADAEGGAQ
jgi:CrcB protein